MPGRSSYVGLAGAALAPSLGGLAAATWPMAVPVPKLADLVETVEALASLPVRAAGSLPLDARPSSGG